MEHRNWLTVPGPARVHDDASALFRRLAMRLNYDLIPPTPRSVLLVGARDATTASTSSLSLGSAMAEESDKRILLIDACPDEPLTTEALGCKGAPGLTNVFAGTISAVEAVLPTSVKNLGFMPAGTAPFEMVEAERVRGLLSSMMGACDFAILSGGSAIQNTMIIALAPIVGCVLLFALENETRSADLETATRTLGSYKAARVGLVIAEPYSANSLRKK